MLGKEEILLCTDVVVEGTDANSDLIDYTMIEVDSCIGTLYDLRDLASKDDEFPYDTVIKHLEAYSRILTKAVVEATAREYEGE